MPDHSRRDCSPSPSPSTGTDGATAALLAGLAAALVAVVVYRDILRAYFWNDDFAWLFLLREHGLGNFLLTPMGGHSLIGRNAIIAVLDGVAGLDARPWFATVLVTHAVNVVLLARLVWLLTGSAALAGVGALAWGICPAASGTLGWYAVYAQVAATTCLLAAFGRVAACARAGRRLSGRDLTVVAAWLALSSAFFGTALAVALVWPLALALLVPGSLATAGERVRVLAVSAAVLALYALLQLIGTHTYESQPLPFQLLSWLGLRWWPAVVSLAQLVRVGVTSLLLGAWWAAGARSDTLSWLTLAGALLACATAMWRAPARLRGMLAACLLLAVAIYALIAVARGPLAGPLFRQTSAQVGATLRYHYAPQAFLVLAACAVLSALAPRAPAHGRDLAALAWGVLLLVGQLRHGVPVDRHDASRVEIARAFDTLHAGIMAAPAGGTAWVQNAPLDTFGWIPNTMDKPPGLAGLFVIAFPADTVDGREVRFVEPVANVREAAQRRDGRTAGLLVAPPGS